MMTSSNGNIFRVTGPLCGEFTGPRWIPPQRPVTRSFDVFFDMRLNKQLSKQSWGWWFAGDLRHYCFHYDVTVMIFQEGEFDWSQQQQTVIFGTYLWGFIVSQIPAGWMASRLGPRFVWAAFMVMTSSTTVLIPLAARTHYFILILMRFIGGVGAVSYALIRCFPVVQYGGRHPWLMVWHQTGNKPLPETMSLVNWTLWKIFQWTIMWNAKKNHSSTCVWKCHLQHIGNVVKATMWFWIFAWLQPQYFVPPDAIKFSRCKCLFAK